jgi:hypothetical protein
LHLIFDVGAPAVTRQLVDAAISASCCGESRCENLTSESPAAASTAMPSHPCAAAFSFVCSHALSRFSMKASENCAALVQRQCDVGMRSITVVWTRCTLLMLVTLSSKYHVFVMFLISTTCSTRKLISSPFVRRLLPQFLGNLGNQRGCLRYGTLTFSMLPDRSYLDCCSWNDSFGAQGDSTASWYLVHAY